MPETEINTSPAARVAPTLGTELRALRVTAELSQRDLAAKINYSHVTIHKAEKCVRPPSWAVVEKIVKACAPPDEDLDWWQSLWKATGPRLPQPPTATTTSKPTRPPNFFVAKRPQRLPAPTTAAGASLPADIDAIRTVRDYTEALRRLRTCSYREIEKRATRALATELSKPDTYTYLWRRRRKKPSSVASSTLADLFRSDRRWLEWHVVRAFLLGCEVSAADLRAWERLLGRVQGYNRPVPVRRSAPHTPPPEMDLTKVDTVPAFVAALKELMRKSGKTMESTISGASRHPGTDIPGRSTVAARFSRGANHGDLPERNLVKAFLRGAYCDKQWPYFCVPDCNADEIAPWMRKYDDLWQQNPIDRHAARS